MNDRINTFMKDCMWFRATIYFLIAAIPALLVDLGQYKSFASIPDISLVIIGANFLLQGLIAVRAFMDQSISRVQRDKKEKKMELITEKTN
jgi:hypothetical protein